MEQFSHSNGDLFIVFYCFICSGQTGSGKTYTMQGPMTEDGLIDFNQRGLIPRTFEYLFECIRGEEETESGREFLCKCSYVEIYNETIFDLLDGNGASSTNCLLREDIKRGVYIEGAREEIINSPSEAYEVYERGSLNRHVAATSMNRESSRSHSVFTLFIQSKQRVGEIMDVCESRFNLVDLAGSERQQATGTTGVRLKEAGNINKSLLALSNVINGLVDISHGRPRHVQYRDSKLTFLLRDSLGGNAKTVIIANVSPSSLYFNETWSTLKFAQRAKMIKNKAIVNKDIHGNVLQLQAEIQRLQHELYLARQTVSSSDNQLNYEHLKKPRLIDAEDGNFRLDPAEAYLMLTMALERQAESSDSIESFKSKLHLLEELVKRKESQNQSLRMILKFRENSLKASNSSASSPSPSSETANLKCEIQELRKIIEHHPEVTRFAYENLQLREKLYKFESVERKMEDFETTLARHRQYEQLLTNRLLVLEKQHKEDEDGEIENQEDDEVSTQKIGTNDQVKSDDQNNDRFNSLSQDHENLCKEYDNLNHEHEKMSKDFDNLNHEFSNLKNEQISLNHEHEKMSKDYENLNHEFSNLKNEQITLNHEHEENLKLIESLNQDIQLLRQEISSLTEANEQSNLERQQQDSTIKTLNESLTEASSKIAALNEKIRAGENISGVLEAERQSLSKVLQERQALQNQFEVSQKTLEREREESKLLLSDYERAKTDFNAKLSELSTQLNEQRDQLEALQQKSKAALTDKTLLQQELEVTRQILAEYKSRDQNTSIAHVQAAETAGKRIVQLETELAALQETLGKMENVASTATALTDRNKILQSENGQLHGKIGKLEFLMRSAQSDNDELMAQVTQLQKHLETSLSSNNSNNSNSSASANASNANTVALEAANHTISSMKRQLTQLETEMMDLRAENEKLTQHQNLKQKLQYHVKIKQENNELQEELGRCREELLAMKGKQENLKTTLNELLLASNNGSNQTSNNKLYYEKIVNLLKSLTL
jgi:kinesin family member 15